MVLVLPGIECRQIAEAAVLDALVVVVAAVEVRTVETGNAVLEREAELDELVLDLVNRLLAEVADVHELRLREGDQLADRVDALALEAVVAAHAQVEVL